MRLILLLVGYTTLLLAITIFHLGARYILPAPWDQINVIFIFLLFFLFIRQSGSVIWMTFFSHMLIELYTTTPYGIVLYSSTLAMVAMHWFMIRVITNRTWYSVTLLSIIGLLLYRSLYTLGIIITSFATGQVYNWRALASDLGWELCLTSLVVAGIAVLLHLIQVRAFHPFIGKIYERSRGTTFRY